MLRLFLAFAAAVSLPLLPTLSTPAPDAVTLSHGGVVAPTGTSANLDDFEIERFDAQYFLDRNDEGHSTLRVVETIVAVFPDFDQNRGIVRALPEEYDGHPTDLTVIAVTDGDGDERSWEEDSESDALTLTIRDDDFLHGEHTFVIEYEQRHVTQFFEDTGSEEFYGDVNGLGWAQPFGEVTAQLHLGDGLEEQLTGNISAVQGGEGATSEARIDGLAFSTDGPLRPHETLTIAVGFEPGTFAPRDVGFFASPAPTIASIAGAVVLLTVPWAWWVRRRHLRDAPGRGIIVPQYTPMAGVSVLTASMVSSSWATRAMPAQLIDLAVRGVVRVLEVEPQPEGREASTQETSKSKKPEYRLELATASGLAPHDRAIVEAVFGADATPGAIHDLSKPSKRASKALEAVQTETQEEAKRAGLRRPYPSTLVGWLLTVAIAAAVTALIAAAIALDYGYGGLLALIPLIVAAVGVVSVIVLVTRRPLGPHGVEIRDHMRGLKDYIELAEADRLRFLQSPEGALRSTVTVADDSGRLNTAEVVRLHERLLPYAMLFGHEKRWTAELGTLYEQLDATPTWLVSSGAFNAAVFASSVSSVSSSVGGAFSSASTGGSTGAVAGGGGGGGGGGGA